MVLSNLIRHPESESPDPRNHLYVIVHLLLFSLSNKYVLSSESVCTEPPTYAECMTGAVDIRDEDDDQQGTMGDMMFTPMYAYVYDYRYRSPPAYSEVRNNNNKNNTAFTFGPFI